MTSCRSFALLLVISIYWSTVVCSYSVKTFTTTFRVPPNVQSGEELESEQFKFHGGEWKLKLSPKGFGASEGYASLYLELESGTLSQPLAVSVALLGERGATVEQKCCESHDFGANPKCVFKEFVEEEYFLEKELGCLNGDEVKLKWAVGSEASEVEDALTTVQGPPVGLHNQANTCYLNSLLQVAFHAPGFASAVLKEPANRFQPALSALQEIFKTLREKRGPGSTRSLTYAMGIDPRYQQDAQEFTRMLLMTLEEEAGERGDAQEGGGIGASVRNIFGGKMLNYIECTSVSESKEWQEPFLDLSLDVKGSGSLTSSLDRYTSPELLTGSNKWRTKEHGLQDARKGVRFLSFPPNLQLHLKRFEYRPRTGDLSKINDPFEFPETVNLSRWLYKTDDKTTETCVNGEPGYDYELSAVLMHQGGPSSGHYYTYIRPDAQGGGVWYKIDDARVTEVTAEEVLTCGRGGSKKSRGGGFLGLGRILGKRKRDENSRDSIGVQSNASAYMLQYVRRSKSTSET